MQDSLALTVAVAQPRDGGLLDHGRAVDDNATGLEKVLHSTAQHAAAGSMQSQLWWQRAPSQAPIMPWTEDQHHAWLAHAWVCAQVHTCMHERNPP